MNNLLALEITLKDSLNVNANITVRGPIPFPKKIPILNNQLVLEITLKDPLKVKLWLKVICSPISTTFVKKIFVNKRELNINGLNYESGGQIPLIQIARMVYFQLSYKLDWKSFDISS